LPSIGVQAKLIYMKLITSLFTLLLTFTFVFGQNIVSIPIGSAVPAADVKMEDISGAKLSLTDIRQDNGLLVIFSCNTCPFVLGWEDRYMPIADWCAANKIGFVLINSNEAQRAAQDGLDKMREHAAEKGYACYYVADKNHEVADAFGATRTPEVFLFDSNLQLVYKGAIDDNMEEPEKVEKPYLKMALEHMVAGKAADPADTKSVGCTIKRLKK
jgi:hypothetical protein